MREGVKAAVSVGETLAMKQFGSRFHDKTLPNCKDIPKYTDEYWECVVRQYTMTIYHMSCTAKMGPPSDPWAVVDPQLRVYGIKGLRVIDASIMPEITSGNIHAPVLMIAGGLNLKFIFHIVYSLEFLFYFYCRKRCRSH